jgi:TolA-binding protein
MTGDPARLAVLVDAPSVPDLVDRTVTLNQLARADSDTLGQLEAARAYAATQHAQMLQAEQESRTAQAAVAAKLADLRRIQSIRAKAKRVLDAKIAALSGQAASLRTRSAELRHLIRQEEQARARQAALRRAAGRQAPPVANAGRRCDLSGTSSAEQWIIMQESGGDPTAANPASTAFGLGQLLLGNRILYLGADHDTVACDKQLAAFRSYVRDRYGTAEAAQAYWQAHSWY